MKSEIIKEWSHAQQKCRIKKTERNYCGYVQADFNSTIDELTRLIDIHGGITYNANGWIGFDTAHAGDYNVDENGEQLSDLKIISKERSWTPKKVHEETEKLARQVKRLKKFLEKERRVAVGGEF